MVITLFIIIFIFTFIFDYLPLIRTGKKNEYLLYGVFLSVSFAVLILTGLGVHVSGPTALIRQLIENMTH